MIHFSARGVRDTTTIARGPIFSQALRGHFEAPKNLFFLFRPPGRTMGNNAAKPRKRTQTAHTKSSTKLVSSTAARWWRKLLENSAPQVEARMSPFAQNSLCWITDQHGRTKAQVAPEQAEAFEKGLKSMLEKQLAIKDGWGVTLHVDYDPDEPLATVMRGNGIPPRIFPPHTWMQVEHGRIQVIVNGMDAIDLLCSQVEPSGP